MLVHLLIIVATSWRYLEKIFSLKRKKNLLNVSATNLNTSIIEHVQGSCTRDGIVTVPVNLLRDYIQNLPSDEKITLETYDEEKPKTTTGIDGVSKSGKTNNYMFNR